MRRTLVGTAFAGFSAFLVSSASGQITNGSFEQPATATFVSVTAPDTVTIPGWNVMAGTVDVGNALGNGFFTGPAYHGTQGLDLNGSSAGTIRQAFPTTPGTSYILSFAYANNYANTTSAPASVVLRDNTNLFLSTTVTHSTSTAGNLDWTLFTHPFTAQEAITTLTFTSLIAGNGGLLLDGVSVVVPEPVTSAVIGTLALATARRRIRTSRAAPAPSVV